MYMGEKRIMHLMRLEGARLIVGAACFLAIPVAGMGTAPAARAEKVNITESLPYIDIQVGRQKFRIKRNQDTKHKLQNAFALTSRPCPPYCIQPLLPAPGVRPAGELEVLEFLRKHGRTMTGVLIDSRTPKEYRKGTIPGAVNVPSMLFSTDNPYKERILVLLGARKLADGTWDYSSARELMLFCNGAFCPQSPKNIKALVDAGYPPEKLHYYRGGVQAWSLLGLPLVKSKRRTGR